MMREAQIDKEYMGRKEKIEEGERTIYGYMKHPYLTFPSIQGYLGRKVGKGEFEGREKRPTNYFFSFHR